MRASRHNLPFCRDDNRRLASALLRRAAPGDWVITSPPYALDYYADRLGYDLTRYRLISSHRLDRALAAPLAGQSDRIWFYLDPVHHFEPLLVDVQRRYGLAVLLDDREKKLSGAGLILLGRREEKEGPRSWTPHPASFLAKLRGWRQGLRANRPALLIFLITLVAYSYFFHRFRFWNVSSRLDLTYAIVDDHSFRIDKYVHHPFYETQDRAFFKGHYYSDKSIGLSVMAAPLYWAMKQAFALAHKDPKPDLSRYGLTVGIISLSSSLLMIVLLRLLTLLGQTVPRACLIVLLFAFGTMLFPFSALFYPYLPSLFFMILAFYLIIRWQRAGVLDERPSWPLGLLLGLALLCEYTVTFPAVLIAGYYALALTRRRKLLPFLACWALPLVFFALYNTVCFETPLHAAVPLFG